MPRTNTKRTTNQKCSTPHCDEPAVILDKCKNCYNYEHRWSRRTPADRYKRLQQVRRFEARLESVRTAPHIRRVK